MAVALDRVAVRIAAVALHPHGVDPTVVPELRPPPAVVFPVEPGFAIVARETIVDAFRSVRRRCRTSSTRSAVDSTVPPRRRTCRTPPRPPPARPRPAPPSAAAPTGLVCRSSRPGRFSARDGRGQTVPRRGATFREAVSVAGCTSARGVPKATMRTNGNRCWAESALPRRRSSIDIHMVGDSTSTVQHKDGGTTNTRPVDFAPDKSMTPATRGFPPQPISSGRECPLGGQTSTPKFYPVNRIRFSWTGHWTDVSRSSRRIEMSEKTSSAGRRGGAPAASRKGDGEQAERNCSGQPGNCHRLSVNRCMRSPRCGTGRRPPWRTRTAGRTLRSGHSGSRCPP